MAFGTIDLDIIHCSTCLDVVKDFFEYPKVVPATIEYINEVFQSDARHDYDSLTLLIQHIWEKYPTATTQHGYWLSQILIQADLTVRIFNATNKRRKNTFGTNSYILILYKFILW